MGCGAAKESRESPVASEQQPAPPSPVGANLRPPPAPILVKRDSSENNSTNDATAQAASKHRVSTVRKKSVMFEQDIKTVPFANGDVYHGMMENDKRNGRGEFTWANGDRYEGEWKDNEKHGTGVFTWSNGDRYEGTYEHGMRSGFGQYSYATGDAYEGEWFNDRRHGKGVYTRAGKNDRYKYDGEWRNDNKEGHGTQEYSSGDVYTGEWSKGKKHGQGEFIHADGRRFTGEFVMDARYRGRLLFPNGDVYEGHFKNDVPWGEGRFIYHTGDIKEYRGPFVEGRRHGPGVEVLSNGEEHCGEFANDRRIPAL